MASTTFIDYSNATPITAAWLNDVNRLQYTILGNPVTSADINNVLGIVNAAHAGGTADALTATYTTPPTAFVDGLVYYVRAVSPNATTTPTFTPNSGVLAATIIVKGNNTALSVGDISGAGHWLALQYDTTLTRWVLLNPATGVSISNKIQPITASVASNALTLNLNPTVLDFRSTTLTQGIPNTRTVSTTLSLTVPTGATLGTINAQSARLILVAIDNAGTVELAVVNLSGGNNLDETSLISTTAISAAATANNVIYSTTARTNVPFRVVGFIDITEAVAGTWATAPTLVQGRGGEALASMSSLGYGQTRKNLIGSRSLGQTYYNTFGKPIAVSVILASGGTGATATLTAGGVNIDIENGSGQLQYATVNGIILPGESYSVTTATGSTINNWTEIQ